jgi:hypothetical protein
LKEFNLKWQRSRDSKNQVRFFVTHFFHTEFFQFTVFSEMILIESFGIQAWHLDSPLPGVFVNIVYLDTGPSRTQFAVPMSSLLVQKKVKEERERLIMEHTFLPFGKGGKKDPIVHEKWKEHLKRE